jgi:hypothetical protein
MPNEKISMPRLKLEQRAVLDDVRKLAGSSWLIPRTSAYIEQLRVYEGQCKAAGLSRMRGLRHRYAQHRYEALTGWKAPATAGPPKRALDESQREKDAAARRVIKRELGHERTARACARIFRVPVKRCGRPVILTPLTAPACEATT